MSADPTSKSGRRAQAVRDSEDAESVSLPEQAASLIREMILSGTIVADTHLQEAQFAERLGMSRTPIRQALSELAREGLLVPGPWRGYKVRAFTREEIGEAFAVRATLEGMACRLVAERGLEASERHALEEILSEGDEMIADPDFGAAKLRPWMEMNRRFHSTLTQLSGNQTLAKVVREVQGVPLVNASHVHRYQYSPTFIDHLRNAHDEHHRIVQAIGRRQSMRAEALMCEHINTAADVLLDKLALLDKGSEAGAAMVVLNKTALD